MNGSYSDDDIAELDRRLRNLIGSARGFLEKFNPADLAEDKSQQWFAAHDAANHLEREWARLRISHSGGGGRMSDDEAWRPWFAWWPVWVADLSRPYPRQKRVWLRTVLRRRFNDGHYRELKP